MGTFQLQIGVGQPNYNSTNSSIFNDVVPFVKDTAVINVPNFGQFSPIDAATTELNIATALDNALGMLWPNTMPADFSANVRQITQAEYDARGDFETPGSTIWAFPSNLGMPTVAEVDNAIANQQPSPAYLTPPTLPT